jgi:hypothetical protein
MLSLPLISGFFLCNRWVEQKEHVFYDESGHTPAAASLTAEDMINPTTMMGTYGSAMHEASISGKKALELDRFLHHFRRWSSHMHSARLERKMKDTVCERLAPVAREAFEYSGDDTFGGYGLSFVHAAFTELLECRSMLQHANALSYYRYQLHDNMVRTSNSSRRKLLAEKVVFEESQSDLEMVVEQISDVVARSHLRATLTQIRFLTAAAVQKRKEFSEIIIHILVDERKQAMAENGAETKRTNRIFLPRDIAEALDDTHVSRDDHDGGSSYRHDAHERSFHSSVRNRIREADTFGGARWACATCTYYNSGGHRRCAMCEESRPL